MIKVELAGMKTLSGYTPAQKDKIIEDLTLPNPQYESMKKYIRGSMRYSKIPKTLDYYTDAYGKLIVPRGYRPPFKQEIIADERIITKVEYPKLHIRLRGTQEDAREAFLAKLEDETSPHGVIVLPTGKGKSILGLYLAGRLKQRVLIVVQKDDLVTGWTEDARLVYGLRPKQVGLVKAGEFRIGKQITITTVQTMAKLEPMQLRYLRKHFGMVIVDEFHHSAAKIYDVVSNFPAKYRVGLTATPSRNDGLTKALSFYFGKVAFEYKDEGGDEDILPVTVHIRNVMINPEIEPEKMKQRHKETGEIVLVDKPINVHQIRAASCYDEHFMTMLCDDLRVEFDQLKSCIVFSHERDHLIVLYNRLLRLGFPENKIQLYVGGENKAIAMSRAESKEVLITLATYHIATEGTNVKAWERAFLASSIANENDTVQSIGRIRRRKAGKPDCVVYDYRFPLVKNAMNHGKKRDAVYEERNFNVIGTEQRKRRKSKQTGRGFGLFRTKR